jgi:hypothetical protein
MFGRAFHCVRCGGTAYDQSTGHCDPCEATYQAELAQAYDDGEPYGVVVGRAYGGEIAIWVHEKAEHCGCRGHGWHSTNVDSWHTCPQHHAGQPHPEFC